MTTQNFRVRKGLTLEGSTSGEVNLAAPSVAGTQSYTLPTALPVSNGYVLASTTGGTLSWVDNSAAGTTYTIDATATTGGANFNLQGSDSTTDTIKFANGSNVTVTRTDANTITIASTDTNTTYDFNASSTTGGANLNLVGSDSTTDTVKLDDGGHITATYTSATEVTLGSDATDANTASTIVARDSNGDFSAGSVTLAGDIAVNGGNITTTATTMNVANTTATTVNAFGDATTTNIGNAGGPAGTAVPGQVNFAGNTFVANNYVKGEVRNTTNGANTTALNGDVFAFSNGTGGRGRGISIDNSIDTTKRPYSILRAYGAGLAAGNPISAYIGESARGSAASPSGVVTGNNLAALWGSAYADTSVGGANPGWLADTVGDLPATLALQANENFTSGTSNLGTRLRVLTSP